MLPAWQKARPDSNWLVFSVGLWQMSNSVRVAIAIFVGLACSYGYFRFLLVPTRHIDLLHRFGPIGYWAAMVVPVIFVAPVLALALRQSIRGLTWVVPVFALFAATAIAALGFYGDQLLCAFVTKDICD